MYSFSFKESDACLDSSSDYGDLFSRPASCCLLYFGFMGNPSSCKKMKLKAN